MNSFFSALPQGALDPQKKKALEERAAMDAYLKTALENTPYKSQKDTLVNELFDLRDQYKPEKPTTFGDIMTSFQEGYQGTPNEQVQRQAEGPVQPKNDLIGGLLSGAGKTAQYLFNSGEGNALLGLIGGSEGMYSGGISRMNQENDIYNQAQLNRQKSRQSLAELINDEQKSYLAPKIEQYKTGSQSNLEEIKNINDLDLKGREAQASLDKQIQSQGAAASAAELDRKAQNDRQSRQIQAAKDLEVLKANLRASAESNSKTGKLSADEEKKLGIATGLLEEIRTTKELADKLLPEDLSIFGRVWRGMKQYATQKGVPVGMSPEEQNLITHFRGSLGTYARALGLEVGTLNEGDIERAALLAGSFANTREEYDLRADQNIRTLERTIQLLNAKKNATDHDKRQIFHDAYDQVAKEMGQPTYDEMKGKFKESGNDQTSKPGAVRHLGALK